MTGCIESDVSLLQLELDETIERLLPEVEDLIQRVSPDEVVTSEADESGHSASVPVRFTDGIGRARVVAQLFRYRDAVRLDVQLDHNRVFARPDGSASGQRCFFNDFVASITLAPGVDELPDDFRHNVLRGITAARNAVQVHNRKHSEPWHQVQVAAV